MKAKAKPKMIKTTLRLPEELWKRVRMHSIEADRDAQDIVADALEQYLKQQKGGRA